MVIRLFFIFVVFAFLCKPTQAQNKAHVETYAWLKEILNQKNDTTYVLNFWATWCLPCVEELPALEQFSQAHKKEKVRVILVSLDFVRKLDITLQPYIDKQKIKTEVVLLNEPNYNSWINKVDKHWGGSIPCTLVWNAEHHFRQLYEEQLSTNHLEELLISSTKKNK